MVILPVSPGPALCEEMLKNGIEGPFDVISPVGEGQQKARDHPHCIKCLM